MRFGKYANELFDFAGGINAGYDVTAAARRAAGKKRVGIAGGAMMVGGAVAGQPGRRSSARNGLQPKGSAPPPGQLPYGY
jgi:hypothetical protein